MVLGGIWVALNYPIVFIASLAVFMAFAVWFVFAFASFVRRRLLRAARRPTRDAAARPVARRGVAR